jgi:hypothetical protein
MKILVILKFIIKGVIVKKLIVKKNIVNVFKWVLYVLIYVNVIIAKINTFFK